MQTPYQSWPNDNCVARSRTRLGTLEGDNETATWDEHTVGGYCSADPAINPMMHDWNQVYLRYCDGGSFSGRVAEPVAANGTTLHFRGHYILHAVLEDLARRHPSAFGRGTDFVVGGSSAGGLAVYLHADTWRAALPDGATVAALPDSGFFLDWAASRPAQATHSFDSDLRWAFHHFNASAGVNAGCIAAKQRRGEPLSDCMFAQHTLPFVTTPLFILQSPYDSWQLQWEHGEGKPLNFTSLNEYGAQLTAALKGAVAQAAGGQPIGGFVEHCYHHCTTLPLWTEAPVVRGLTQSTAFQHWFRALGNHSPPPAQASLGPAVSAAAGGGAGSGGGGILWQEGALPCRTCGCPPASLGPTSITPSPRGVLPRFPEDSL